MRWLITGAVRRATAVMGLYLRSFEATNLIYAAETPSVLQRTTMQHFLGASRRPLLRIKSVAAALRMKPAAQKA